MIYLLDTNAVSDLSRNHAQVIANQNLRFRQKHHIGLCPPVYYENLRGLLKANATTQVARLQNMSHPGV